MELIYRMEDLRVVRLTVDYRPIERRSVQGKALAESVPVKMGIAVRLYHEVKTMTTSRLAKE